MNAPERLEVHDSPAAAMASTFMRNRGWERDQLEMLRRSDRRAWSVAAGAIVGGTLADRVGGKRVMLTSMLVSAPLMALVPLLGDWRAFYVAPFLGFASGAAWPPMLVMAQSLFPKNAGVGSGVALGFVFAMGALGLQLTGWLAEPQRLGLFNAMLMLCLVPLISALLVKLLPSSKRAKEEQPLKAIKTVAVAAGK